MSIRCNEWTVCSWTCFLFVYLKGFDFAKCEVLLISTLLFRKSQESSHLEREHFMVVSEQHYYFCCRIQNHLCQKLKLYWCIQKSRHPFDQFLKWKDGNATPATVYFHKDYANVLIAQELDIWLTKKEKKLWHVQKFGLPSGSRP